MTDARLPVLKPRACHDLSPWKLPLKFPEQLFAVGLRRRLLGRNVGDVDSLSFSRVTGDGGSRRCGCVGGCADVDRDDSRLLASLFRRNASAGLADGSG